MQDKHVPITLVQYNIKRQPLFTRISLKTFHAISFMHFLLYQTSFLLKRAHNGADVHNNTKKETMENRQSKILLFSYILQMNQIYLSGIAIYSMYSQSKYHMWGSQYIIWAFYVLGLSSENNKYKRKIDICIFHRDT